MTLDGISRPENGVEFYNQISDKIAGFHSCQKSRIDADIRLGYFNSQSSKSLYLLFKELKQLSKAGKSLAISWYYDGEDENIEEFVELLREDLGLKVNLVTE
ncbi:MAG: SiaC family regulatory phosphoprotein [Flavobacteriales bacterium]|nr:SiaC family regulatory phosphoprotein [Flavobacteriales bacterium]